MSRSSNSPRYFEPAISAPMSSATTRRSRSDSGTSPETMRWARPSTIAVLPTPGSPISTGLFFVRRLSTWMTRRISSSRPMTGSSLPLRGALGQVDAELLERLDLVLGRLVGDARAGRGPPRAPRTQLLLRRAGAAQRRRRPSSRGRRATAAGARSRRTRRPARASRARPRAAPGRARSDGLPPASRAGAHRRQAVERGVQRPRAPPRRRRRACAGPTGRCRRPARAARRAGARAWPAGCGGRSARRPAAAMASWDLMVKRSGCMKSKSVGLRSV